jgi:hypothetical protein
LAAFLDKHLQQFCLSTLAAPPTSSHAAEEAPKEGRSAEEESHSHVDGARAAQGEGPAWWWRIERLARLMDPDLSGRRKL